MSAKSAAAARLSRMRRELKLLETDPPPGISAWPEGDSLNEFRAQIRGPEDSPYAKGTFKLEILIPDRYPCDPPKVRFLTPIYHPNIDTGGRICLDTLKMPPKGGWTPSLNLGTVLVTIRLLMAEPNPGDGLMGDISQQYINQKQAFLFTAKEWTRKHATEGSTENVGQQEGKSLESGPLVSISASAHTSSLTTAPQPIAPVQLSATDPGLAKSVLQPTTNPATRRSMFRHKPANPQSDTLQTPTVGKPGPSSSNANGKSLAGLHQESDSEADSSLSKRRRDSPSTASVKDEATEKPDQLFVDFTADDPFEFHASSAVSARLKKRRNSAPLASPPVPPAPQVETKRSWRSNRRSPSSFSSTSTNMTLSDKWQCSKCTLLNLAPSMKCAACAESRPCVFCRGNKGSKCTFCNANSSAKSLKNVEEDTEFVPSKASAARATNPTPLIIEQICESDTDSEDFACFSETQSSGQCFDLRRPSNHEQRQKETLTTVRRGEQIQPNPTATEPTRSALAQDEISEPVFELLATTLEAAEQPSFCVLRNTQKYSDSESDIEDCGEIQPLPLPAPLSMTAPV